MKLTRQQVEAVSRVFHRAPLYRSDKGPTSSHSEGKGFPITYLQFRRTVEQGPDCAMVKWCGMWLGIEPDGYVHS